MGKEWDKPWAAHFTGIGDGPPLPDRQLHVNPRCRICGGYERGTKKPCRCESPEWNDTQGAAIGRKNRAFGEWNQAWATEALRVLKPSHYLLAFGGTRTWHRLACAIEDAGFEIRDTLMWLYGSGFPKGKSCLKPAWEPIILARKPGPMRELGIEECRVGTEPVVSLKGLGQNSRLNDDGWKGIGHRPEPTTSTGRWPANLVLECTCAETREGTVKPLEGHRPNPVAVQSDGQIQFNKKPLGFQKTSYTNPDGKEPVRIHTDPNCPCAMLDGQTGTCKSSGLYERRIDGPREGPASMRCKALESSMYTDSGGASRFFFRADYDEGER